MPKNASLQAAKNTPKGREKGKKRKLSKPIGLPRRGIYTVAIGALKSRMKRFNVNVTRENLDSIHSPCVVLSNHCSKQDWIFVGEIMMPKLLNVVITHYYYSDPKLRLLLRRAGAIPKDQFSPDVAAIKSMLSVASKGGNIMLFPEGRTTPSGETETFERAAIKLLRHLKMPVVGMHMDGAYLTMPKWNDTPREGRIDIRVFPLFTVEELDSLTDDEAFEKMCRELYTDEYKWQKKNRVRFKGADNAEGLENILFMCPKCGAEMTTETEGDTISCSKCGNGARLNEYYDFLPLDDECVIPENISEWYKWQVAEQNRKARENEDIFMTDRVILRQPTEHRSLHDVGEGVARLDRTGFHYKGTCSGEEITLDMPLTMLPAVAFSPGRTFELYYRGKFYCFVPENSQSPQKWSMLAEELHNIYCE